VWEWIVCATLRNLSISRIEVQEPAKEVAEKLEESKLRASNG
jgi:hypothetical protein